MPLGTYRAARDVGARLNYITVTGPNLDLGQFDDVAYDLSTAVSQRISKRRTSSIASIGPKRDKSVFRLLAARELRQRPEPNRCLGAMSVRSMPLTRASFRRDSDQNTDSVGGALSLLKFCIKL